MRRAPGANRGRARRAVGEDRQRVVRRRVAVDADAIKRARADVTQSFLQKLRRDGGIGYDESECRRQVGVTHPCALRAAYEMNSLAGHFERSARGFWARVRRANGER